MPRKSSSLTNVSKVEETIVLSDSDKIEIVQNQINKNNLIFESSDIVFIAKNISSEFKDRKSLNSEIIQAIKNYVKWQTDQEKQEIQNVVDELIESRNYLDKSAINSFAVIADNLKENNQQWEQAKNEILDLFSIPE